MPQPVPRLWAAASVALLSGCDGRASSDPSARGLQVVDSAGVEIVRDGREEVPLAVEERLRIGVLEGDPDSQFDRVWALTPDGEGGVWVVDRDPSVRRYDAEGRLRARVGGRGQGPGEADTYWGVVRGDGWVALHGTPGVIQRFLPDGTFLGARATRLEDGSSLAPLQWSSGRLLFLANRVPFVALGGHALRTGESGYVRIPMEVMAGPDTLKPLSSVTAFLGGLRTETGGAGPYLFGTPMAAADAQGRVFVSDSLSYRVEVFDLEGRLRRVIERPLPPTSVPSDYEVRFRRGVETISQEGIPGFLAGRPLSLARGEIEGIVASGVPLELPDYLPFIDGLLVGPEGTVWVERADRHPRPALRGVAHAFGYHPSTWHGSWKAPRIFDLFDPGGRYGGTVEFPADVVPMAVEGSRAYAVHTDELGVERVVILEVERP